MRFVEPNRPIDRARAQRVQQEIEEQTARGRDALARLVGETQADQLIAASISRAQTGDAQFATRPTHEQRAEVVRGLCRERDLDVT